MQIFLILHLPFAVVSYSQWHYESFCDYTSPLCTQRLLSEPLWNLDMCEGGSLLFSIQNGTILYRHCHRDSLRVLLFLESDSLFLRDFDG